MHYRILADITVGIHLLFVLFVLCGGFAVIKWPRLIWAHIPAVIWGAAIELIGWICPLTYLENYFRALGQTAGYETSFVEQYILPILYPTILFKGDFPAYGFTIIGFIVLIINGVLYWKIFQRSKKQP